MKFPIGLRIDGIVNNVTDLGIFVNLPHHHHGLIHHKDFGDRWPKIKKKTEVGQTIRVVIVNNYHGKLALSVSRVNDASLVDPTNVFNEEKDFKKVLTDLSAQSQKVITNLKAVIKEESV